MAIRSIKVYVSRNTVYCLRDNCPINWFHNTVTVSSEHVLSQLRNSEIPLELMNFELLLFRFPKAFLASKMKDIRKQKKSRRVERSFSRQFFSEELQSELLKCTVRMRLWQLATEA